MTKIEKKFVVQECSKISDIYSKLNSVQKQTIVLFDTDRDGVLDRFEARAFNKTGFSDKGDTIDCWLQLSSGKKQKVSVNKDDFDTRTLSLFRVESRKHIMINGKKMNVLAKYDKLQEDSGSSINEKFTKSLPSYEGYKLVSTDKNGNKKYVAQKAAPHPCNNTVIHYEDYVILDVLGNILEKSKADLIGDSAYFDGRIVTKGDCTEYYDIDNKKYGEIQVNGKKTQYKDKNGQVLYSKVEHDERYYTYYDKNNKPLYDIRYSYGEPYADVTYLDKNGNEIKTERAYVSAQPFHDYGERFHMLQKDPINEDGELSLYS